MRQALAVKMAAQPGTPRRYTALVRSIKGSRGRIWSGFKMAMVKPEVEAMRRARLA
jgi:hypothetical protein